MRHTLRSRYRARFDTVQAHHIGIPPRTQAAGSPRVPDGVPLRVEHHRSEQKTLN